MHENLEKFLEEISHYLVGRGRDEILAEIRSHILEKTEREEGRINTETLARTIEKFGKPRTVAEQYAEGTQIIAPAYKNYLSLYSGILMAFNFGLLILACVTRSTIISFPFIFIPRLTPLEALLYVPVIACYSVGLAGLFFYYLSRKESDLRLPWPAFHIRSRMDRETKSPRFVFLILRLAGFVLLNLVYHQYHSLFLMLINQQKPQSLLIPGSARFYSLLLIIAAANGIVLYGLRFFIRDRWLRPFRSGLALLVLWVFINQPVKLELAAGVPVKDLLAILFFVSLSVLTAAAVIKFILSLFGLMKRNA